MATRRDYTRTQYIYRSADKACVAGRRRVGGWVGSSAQKRSTHKTRMGGVTVDGAFVGG